MVASLIEILLLTGLAANLGGLLYAVLLIKEIRVNAVLATDTIQRLSRERGRLEGIAHEVGIATRIQDEGRRATNNSDKTHPLAVEDDRTALASERVALATERVADSTEKKNRE